MKKTVKRLPIILYPYIYMVCLAGYFGVCFGSTNPTKAMEIALVAMLAIAVVCNLYSFITAASLLRGAGNGTFAAKDLAKLNLTVKLVQIPAYILHFCLGLVGLVMSVWGIPVILWAIFIDLATILLSGSVGASAAISGKKERILSSRQAALYALLGFVFCVDVVVAVVLYSKIGGKTESKWDSTTKK